MKVFENTTNIQRIISNVRLNCIKDIDWDNAIQDVDSIILPFKGDSLTKSFEELTFLTGYQEFLYMDYNRSSFTITVDYSRKNFHAYVTCFAFPAKLTEDDKQNHINNFCENVEEVTATCDLFDDLDVVLESGEPVVDSFKVQLSAKEKESLLWNIMQMLTCSNGGEVA